MRKTAILAILVFLATSLTVSAGKRRAVRHPAPESLPLAVNDAYENSQGISLGVLAPGVLVNDTLNQAVIASYGATSGSEQTVIGTATVTARGGSVTLQADGSLSYLATPGFSGSDSFRYVLRNGSGTAAATVTITVIPTPPLAVNDSFNTLQNTALTAPSGALFANDSLHGATLVSYGASTGTEKTTGSTPTSANGTVVVATDGGFLYNPRAGFTGNDSFKYVVENAGGSSTATVTITVQAPTPDFTVTSPGFFYQISGLSGQNPVITLTRGRTYRFQINTDSSHPFEIQNAPPGSVTNNNISQGIITFVVPATASNYHYHCSIHEFGNAINTVP